MSRLNAIDPSTVQGKAKTLLDNVKAALGVTPNLTRVMANSPAVLEAYLNFSAALRRGSLGAKLREQIALAVAEENGCDYCLAAHSLLGKQAGLTADDVLDARRARATDPRSDAAVTFARLVVEERGRVTDAQLARLREAGFGDGDIAEIVAEVALNLFTNYVNHVAETEVDFPPVPALVRDARIASRPASA
jgi:uncharacterized peroxidase-related enzyme